MIISIQKRVAWTAATAPKIPFINVEKEKEKEEEEEEEDGGGGGGGGRVEKRKKILIEVVNKLAFNVPVDQSDWCLLTSITEGETSRKGL